MEREFKRPYSEHGGEMSPGWADKVPELKQRHKWYSIPTVKRLFSYSLAIREPKIDMAQPATVEN